MPEIFLTNGQKYFANPGVTVLESANRAQIQLPYSCKAGRCSACKCKLISGKTSLLQTELGITEQEKADGWILSCINVAETDLVIESDDFDGISLPVPKTYPCRIKGISSLASKIVQVFLRLPPGTDFSFLPGQYIDLIGPKGVRRSYSLANAIAQDGVLELHIKQVDEGVLSKYWFESAKIGDILRVNGPLGTFFLRNTNDKDLYFLATGTGIAPVKAMLESLEIEKHKVMPRSVTVIWGGRNAGDLYYNINSTFYSYKYIPVLSRPNEGWDGATGYVQDLLLKLNPDFANSMVYACGSDAMIRDAKKCLFDAGLPQKNFHSDAFVCTAEN